MLAERKVARARAAPAGERDEGWRGGAGGAGVGGRQESKEVASRDIPTHTFLPPRRISTRSLLPPLPPAHPEEEGGLTWRRP